MQPQKTHIQAAMPIPRYSCVTASGEVADSGNPAHQDHITGVTDGAIGYNAGPPVHADWGDVTTAGLIYEMTWTWTPGQPIYLNGTVLSQTPPGVGFTQQVGWALTGQSMLVQVMGTGAGGVGPPGPPGPPGPAGNARSTDLIDTWDPLYTPPDPTIPVFVGFRDGTANRWWDPAIPGWSPEPP